MSTDRTALEHICDALDESALEAKRNPGDRAMFFAYLLNFYTFCEQVAAYPPEHLRISDSAALRLICNDVPEIFYKAPGAEDALNECASQLLGKFIIWAAKSKEPGLLEAQNNIWLAQATAIAVKKWRGIATEKDDAAFRSLKTHLLLSDQRMDLLKIERSRSAPQVLKEIQAGIDARLSAIENAL